MFVMLAWFLINNAHKIILGFKGLFDPQRYIFSCSMPNSRSIDISHDYTDFGGHSPFLDSEVLFPVFDPQKYVFSSSIQNFRSIHGSHDLFHF
jgi:hypothetical protein